MLLALDTSSGSSVALVDAAGTVLAERAEADTRRHAEVIGLLIRGVLEDAGIRAAQVDAVGAGMGPGPFTGLRVGIAAARAFAIGVGARLVPVVSHDAIAMRALEAGAGASVGPQTGGILVVTDARRREVYWSAYSGLDADGIPVVTDGPGLCSPADLPHPDLARIDGQAVSAGILGRLAATQFRLGRAHADAQPLYLRSPDVTPAAGRKRVTA